MEEEVLKRVMPHSTEAEQSVIGAMILDNESIASVENLLISDDFYQKQYGIIFDAIMDLYRSNKPVDLLTLKSKLQEKNVAPEISNMTYIGDLIANVPISGNAKYYAEIVREKATLRKLIHAGEDIASACYVGKDKVDNIMSETEDKIFKILNQRRTTEFVPIEQVVFNVVDRIREASRTKNPITGVATGFRDLDYRTTGFQPSDLILIAARPSMGKTAFVLNIAQNVACRSGQSVAIFSLEMSKEQLVNRLLSMESRVDSQRLRTGNLDDNDWYRLGESAEVLASSKLIIDDTPGISIGELRTKCRKFKLDHDIKMVIIDYLQLMSAGVGSNAASRQQEISDISRALKGLARELKVPVVALSQLSRAPEQRLDHRPMMSDLRESGAIEQDADVVMFIYRDDYYNKDSEKKNVAEVIIGKQRQGPIGTIELAWLPDFTKFQDLERDF